MCSIPVPAGAADKCVSGGATSRAGVDCHAVEPMAYAVGRASLCGRFAFVLATRGKSGRDRGSAALPSPA